jgi:hypothetical protein
VKRPLPKRECLCGRMVAVRFELQRGGGGKARVPHLCPHGKPCVAGIKPSLGHGHNHNSRCLDCLKREAE